MKKFIFCIIVSSFLLTSCKEGDVKNTQNRSSNFTITDGTSKTYKNRGEVSGAEDFTLDNYTSSERAQILSEVITNMDGIEKAAVIITGNAAIVGITTTGELTDQKLTKYKNDVEEKVKLTDKNIRMVAVTAAGDLVERIMDLSNQDKEDNDSSSLDIRNILYQITPTI